MLHEALFCSPLTNITDELKLYACKVKGLFSQAKSGQHSEVMILFREVHFVNHKTHYVKTAGQMLSARNIVLFIINFSLHNHYPCKHPLLLQQNWDRTTLFLT